MLILIGLFDNDGVGGSRYLRGAVRCGLLEGIGDRSKLVDSFLNPVAWFLSSQLYESYWNINLFGKPVNALTANTCFQLVLAIGCVADSILLGNEFRESEKSHQDDFKDGLKAQRNGSGIHLV